MVAGGLLAQPRAFTAFPFGNVAVGQVGVVFYLTLLLVNYVVCPVEY